MITSLNQRLYLSPDSSHSSASASAQVTTSDVHRTLASKEVTLARELITLGQEVKSDFKRKLPASKRTEIEETIDTLERDYQVLFGEICFYITSQNIVTPNKKMLVVRCLQQGSSKMAPYFINRASSEFPGVIQHSDPIQKAMDIAFNPEASKPVEEIASAVLDMQNDTELRKKIARLLSLQFGFNIAEGRKEIMPVFNSGRNGLIHLDLCTGISGLGQIPETTKFPNRQFAFVDRSDLIEEVYRSFIGFAETTNVQLVKADILDLPYIFRTPESVSDIRLANVGNYVADIPETWFDEMSKLIVRGGNVVISAASDRNFCNFTHSDIEGTIQKENMPLLHGFLKSLGKRMSDVRVGHIDTDGRFIPNQTGFIGAQGKVISDSLVVITK
jgi:hypothetical protein